MVIRDSGPAVPNLYKSGLLHPCPVLNIPVHLRTASSNGGAASAELFIRVEVRGSGPCGAVLPLTSQSIHNPLRLPGIALRDLDCHP
jgi:hypothetical protein